MNVFDIALDMEKESMACFERMAAEATRKELSVLYSLLADSEREHYDHVMHLKQGTDPQKATSSVADRIRRQIPEMMASILTAAPSKDDDGYRQVIQAEETAIRLYEKLAEHEPNHAAAALLRQMADEEKTHLEVMENIYDYVEAPRTYLEWGEFSNLRTL